MRILPLLLVGLSALALSACDELKGSREANADCCCKTCPTPPPTKPAATPPAEEATVKKVETTEVQTTAVRKTKAVGHRRVQHTGGGYRAGGYRYRSGTEGVGYLDEDLAGGSQSSSYQSSSYRGSSYRSVEIDERETYSERYSSSESGYAYGGGGSRYSERGSGYGHGGGYSEGSDESYGGGHKRGGHKRKRDRSYVGTDRDGYLTWPGKTP